MSHYGKTWLLRRKQKQSKRNLNDLPSTKDDTQDPFLWDVDLMKMNSYGNKEQNNTQETSYYSMRNKEQNNTQETSHANTDSKPRLEGNEEELADFDKDAHQTKRSEMNSFKKMERGDEIADERVGQGNDSLEINESDDISKVLNDKEKREIKNPVLRQILNVPEKSVKMKTNYITIGTGYRVPVSNAEYIYFTKKFKGEDKMVPKRRITLMKRYRKDYHQYRKNPSYLKKGNGVKKERPISAPLVRYADDLSPTLTKINRKRPNSASVAQKTSSPPHYRNTSFSVAPHNPSLMSQRKSTRDDEYNFIKMKVKRNNEFTYVKNNVRFKIRTNTPVVSDDGISSMASVAEEIRSENVARSTDSQSDSMPRFMEHKPKLIVKRKRPKRPLSAISRSKPSLHFVSNHVNYSDWSNSDNWNMSDKTIMQTLPTPSIHSNDHLMNHANGSLFDELEEELENLLTNRVNLFPNSDEKESTITVNDDGLNAFMKSYIRARGGNDPPRSKKMQKTIATMGKRKANSLTKRIKRAKKKKRSKSVKR